MDSYGDLNSEKQHISQSFSNAQSTLFFGQLNYTLNKTYAHYLLNNQAYMVKQYDF
jgi:hypothetical protein